MNSIKLATALAAICSTCLAGTFQSIKFNQPTLSDEDPLGVSAITNVQKTVQSVQTKVTTLETSVTNLNEKLGGDTVVLGSVKGDVIESAMTSDTNKIVLAVNRDMDDMENNAINISADKIKFDSLDHIYVGSVTLGSLITWAAEAGQMNVIETIKTNGIAVAVSDKAVDIAIPSINGLVSETSLNTALGDYVRTTDMTATLGDYVKATALRAGVTNILETGVETITVSSSIKVKGTEVATNGHVHAVADISDLHAYTIPGMNAAATTATNEIDQATSIAELKAAMTKFILSFKAP